MSMTDNTRSGGPLADLYDATYDARDAYWRSVGTLEPDVLTYLICPEFLGAPAWPTTRQAFRVVHRANTILLATDGLSEPAGEDPRTNGLGLELFIESPDVTLEDGNTSMSARASWAFDVLNRVAGALASTSNTIAMLDEVGAFSIQIDGAADSNAITEQVPARFVTTDGCMGALIGGPAPDFPTIITDTPLSPVRIVPVVVITARELDAVRARGGDAARRALVDALASSTGHLSLLTRSDLA